MSGWVAGAIVVSAAVNAYSARKQRKAEEQARRDAMSAQERAAAEQREALAEAREGLKPYEETALEANEQLNRLLAGDWSGFEESPGYQYRQEQGAKQVSRIASKQGFLGTPQQQLAVQRRGQDIASQEYNNYLNSLLVTSGRGASLTGGPGQAYGQNVANVYANLGNFGAQNALLAGQQRGSTYQGYGNIAQNALNQYMQYRGYQSGQTGNAYGGERSQTTARGWNA